MILWKKKLKFRWTCKFTANLLHKKIHKTHIAVKSDLLIDKYILQNFGLKFKPQSTKNKISFWMKENWRKWGRNQQEKS